MNSSVHIGFNVTIGAGCSLYSCHIEDDVVIGDKCVILEGARLEAGCMIAPGSVVPPGRLIPAKQLWGGNPVEYMKDMDIGELWSNYSLSYMISTIGESHKNEFTLWNAAYLKREANQDDVETLESNLDNAYTTKNLLKGCVKYYA